MKIAHTIHGLGLGGAQRIIATIVRGRRDKRLQHFVYSCADGVHRREIEAAGATVRILPRVLPRFCPIWVRRLARAMRRDQIDVVHGHLFGDSLHGLVAARLAGRIPLIMTLHTHPRGWKRLQRLVYPWLLSRCRRAIVCSPAIEREVRQQYPRVGRVLASIPNGIEDPGRCDRGRAERLALKEALGLQPGSTVVAAVGRLTKVKGYNYLLSAFARTCQDESSPDLQLVLLGEGELGPTLKRQAAKEGISDHVLFPGFRSDVNEWLEAAEVVVFSSICEGLPLALLEAMATGCCIVATDLPGIRGAIRHDQEAVIVPAADSEALSGAIHRVVTDPVLRRRLGQAARHRFLRDFTGEKMVQRYEHLYGEIIGNDCRRIESACGRSN